MRILFIGSVKLSGYVLQELITMQAGVVGVCTLAESKFNSDHCDLTTIAYNASIPVRYTPEINEPEVLNWIMSLRPDVIFCFGWSRLIKSPLLNLPRLGVIGFHPAYLPANRGRHPLVWALVLGLEETASTFFFMDQNADSGDILSQKKININLTDNALTLYAKITEAALEQIRDFVPRLIDGNFNRQPQDHRKANMWRKRGLADGRIDWRMAAISIHNLVRGLTRPYIGAHFDYNNQAIKVWRSEIVVDVPLNIEPGKVLQVDTHGVLVKAGIDAILLCEIDPKIEILADSYL